MTPEERAAWDAAVSSGALDEGAGPGMAADAFQYDLTVREDGDEQTVRFDEFSLPPELESLVRLLERHAMEVAARRRRA